MGTGALLSAEPAGPPSLRDGPLLGALFESLVTLSVRVYAQAARARVGHLRTRNGDHEVDLIVERRDGRILAIESKLAAVSDDRDVHHLHWLARRTGADLLDAVVVTSGPYAYRRPDGIAVVPAALLGPGRSRTAPDVRARPNGRGAPNEPLSVPPGDGGRNKKTGTMRTLEDITYDAGLHALADQEALVAGIRQRTGTLLAAHALVASFLGAAALRAHGLSPFTWVALAALVLGLLAAAVLLAPWRLRFAVNAHELYDNLDGQASAEASAKTLAWLVAAGYGYQALHEANRPRVRRMSRLSGILAALMVAQTLAWMAALVIH